MKGLLATVCALTLLCSVSQATTFPNDLYYHHHPNMAIADAHGGQVTNRHARPNNGGHSRNRHNYHHPHRNAYHDRGRDHHYRHDKRANYGDEGESKIKYTEDGAIDWSNSQVHKKMAATDHQEQSQEHTSSNNYEQQDQQNNHYDGDSTYQQGRQYDTSPYYYGQGRSPYDDESDYSKDYSNDYNDDYRDGSYYNRNKNYNSQPTYNEDENRGYRNSPYGEEYGYNYDYDHDFDDEYKYENRQRGQGSDDYYNEQPDYNTRESYKPNTRNAYVDAKDTPKSNFAGGLRLAGTLPDDGYNRGEGTFYDLETHISACGKQNKNTEFVAALNAEQMGDSSSNNEHCGKEVDITGPSGKTIRATIVDSCKTCNNGGLDLSPAAFGEIGEFSQGSIPIKWKFV